MILSDNLGRCAVTVSVIFTLISGCVASHGDSSHPYRKCLKVCLSSRCNHPAANLRFYDSQPLHLRLLGWDCVSECKHDCMWEAVDTFLRNDGHVPQFHGKWPFIRWMGMQEPASAIASLLNGLTNYLMLRRFERIVPPTTPFYHLWRFYAAVAINAWFWSFVFHVRDTDWTEKFDYFSAFSIVLVQLFCCVVRIVGASPVRKPLALGVALGLFFLHHCFSMTWHKFDYGYNMKVNLFFAGVNVVSWIVFCGFKMSRGYSYFWTGFMSAVWLASSALLETLDFPPVLWVVDSHALWHMSTIMLPFLFYRFFIEDSLALLQGDERSAKTAYVFEMDLEDGDLEDNRRKGD